VSGVLKAVRVALCEELKAAWDLPGFPGLPSQITAGAFWLRPSRDTDYVSFEGELATWCRPEVSYQAVLTAPSQNYADFVDWIDDRVEEVVRGLEGNPTLGGRTSPIMLATVSEPGLIEQTLLAVEFTFKPFVVTDLTIGA
jgi:hypothetical protein